MLTIPDDLIQSARIDGASEWRIYWQIILPLAGPALAVLAIFSVMWRWNDFLWPLIVVSKTELFTLAGRPERVSGRTESAVELHPGDDGSDAAADQHRLCVSGTLHHHRHCDHRNEVIANMTRITCPTRVSLADPATHPLVLVGQRGERFAISVLDDDLIRVQHFPDGQPRLERTWMVVGREGDVPREGRRRDDLSPFVAAWLCARRAGKCALTPHPAIAASSSPGRFVVELGRCPGPFLRRRQLFTRLSLRPFW